MERKVVISQNATPLPPGFLTELFFGKSLGEFAQEIRDNRGGKYDRCYEQKKEGAGSA